MLKRLFIYGISMLVFLGHVESMQKNSILLKEKVVKEIKGSYKIKDNELRKRFLEFFSISNYKEEYNYLSREYLMEYYPNIKSAEEYDRYLRENVEEHIKTEYVEITDSQKISKNKYQIDMIVNAQDSPESPEMTKIKQRYIFVKEDNVWKYNGIDPNFYEEVR